MDSLDIRNLYAAYRSVYDDQQSLTEDVDVELDEETKGESHMLKGAEGMSASDRANVLHQVRRANRANKDEKTDRQRVLSHKLSNQRDRNERKGYDEEVDVYDLVLDHLLDEGYCDDEESAEVIMANMSEEWLEFILEKADNTIRLVFGKGGKGVPINDGSGNVLRKPNVGFDKQGDSFRQATRDAARRFAEKQNKSIDIEDRVNARLTAKHKKNIGRLNAQSNNKQSEGGYNQLTPGKSHYGEVPTDYRARKRRASGR